MIDYLKKFSLKEKVAFVTGGAGLLGSEVSRCLASAGAHTVILDIDRKKAQALEKKITTSGYMANYEYFDSTKFENIKGSMQNLIAKYKSVDIWINAAYPRTKDWGHNVERLKLASWRKNVDMHLNSYAWLSKEVALLMKKKKTQGAIINFGSTYGVVGPDFSLYSKTKMTSPMAYSAIKGGIINTTRYLASYFGKYGIRVNNVCPGGIFDHQDVTFVRNYERKVPLKRMGTPKDIAPVVLFLASDAASYVNGATIMIDGGWTIV